MSSVATAKFKSRLVECIRHFTPAWFAAIMGTGAIGILFHNFPYAEKSTTMEAFAHIFFFLNLSLFILFNILTGLRYMMFPEIWNAVIHHPTQSLYLGTYPMGASTLITVAVGVIFRDDDFGSRGFLYTLWVLWWLDVILSIVSAYLLVYIMATRQKHTLDSMTAAWLLPVVTLIVISSTGGTLAAPLAIYSSSKSLVTLTVSAILVMMGLGLAFMMLTIYLLRLIIHGIPSGSGVLSVFMPLGPMAQGGYSILLLGAGYRSLLPLSYGNSPVLRQETVGQIIDVVALAIALVLWALATVWLLYALLATGEVLLRSPVPFKQAFWGLIFPNGVYANLTIQLYRTTDSIFFRVLGAIYSLATLILWIVVFVRTCMLVYSGAMFRAPCLEDVDIHNVAMEKQQAMDSDQTIDGRSLHMRV